MGPGQEVFAHPAVSLMTPTQLPQHVVDAVLADVAPSLDMTLDEARDAFQQGDIQIQEEGTNSEGTVYRVIDVAGGVDILSILEDIA